MKYTFYHAIRRAQLCHSMSSVRLSVTFSLGIPNPEPSCQTWVLGLESHQTRVSGRVWVWEDGDRIQVKQRKKFAICGWYILIIAVKYTVQFERRKVDKKANLHKN